MFDNTFFINYLAEYDYLKNKYHGQNNLFLCRNYNLYRKLDEPNVHYYYKKSSGANTLFEQCFNVSQNWFLSDKKIDLISDKISIGLILVGINK